LIELPQNTRSLSGPACGLVALIATAFRLVLWRASPLFHKSNFIISQENVMTQNAWKCVIAVSLFSAYTLAAVPLFGQALTQPVQVVNTPNVNVVNTPSVSVSNTPNVSVSNTPSVNVANTPTVTLEAGASVNVTSPLDGSGNPSPIAVLDAFQPYEDYCEIRLNGAQMGTCNFDPVPSGKRLLIQEVDFFEELDPGLAPAITSVVTNPTTAHYFNMVLQGLGSGVNFFAAHQETRLYVGAGGQAQCYIEATGVAEEGFIACIYSGFLVDVPVGSDGKVINGGQHQRPSIPPMRRPAPPR
jgi:hypothetical protein